MRNIAVAAVVVVALFVAVVLGAALISRSERHVVESKRAEAVAAADHAAAEAKARIAAQLGLTSATDSSPALPITRQAVLDTLKARGYTVEAFEIAHAPANAETYRLKDSGAGLTFLERDGKLRSIVMMTYPAGDKSNGERVQDFLEVVGEIVLKITRDEARIATAQAMVDLGKEPLGPHRLVGYATADVLVKVTRMPDRGYMFTFFPAPKLDE